MPPDRVFDAVDVFEVALLVRVGVQKGSVEDVAEVFVESGSGFQFCGSWCLRTSYGWSLL
jgi:hypothetical protein